MPRTVVVPPNWLRRARDHLAAALAALRRARRHSEVLAHERRQAALLAELDPRVLRDIGAPAWLEAEARGRRDARTEQRESLRMGAAAVGARDW